MADDKRAEMKTKEKIPIIEKKNEKEENDEEFEVFIEESSEENEKVIEPKRIMKIHEIKIKMVDTKNFVEWKNHFTAMASYTGWTEEMKIMKITECMQNETIPEKIMKKMVKRKKITVEEYLKAIEDKIPKRNEYKILQNMKYNQRDSVVDFADEIKKQCKKVNSTMTNIEKCTNFCQSLPYWIQDDAEKLCIQNDYDLITVAKILELSMERKKQRYDKNKIRNHDRRYDNRRYDDRRYDNRRYDNRRYDDQIKSKDIRKCFNCGSANHIAKNCRNESSRISKN